MDNSRLRDDLARTRDELSAAKKKLETGLQVNKYICNGIIDAFFGSV